HFGLGFPFCYKRSGWRGPKRKENRKGKQQKKREQKRKETEKEIHQKRKPPQKSLLLSLSCFNPKNPEIEKFQRGKSPRFLYISHSTKSQKEAARKEFKAHSSSNPTTKFYTNQSRPNADKE
ncbi:hypothetical protein LINPERHAP2_LOCUS23093, partial [Linum perenne]